MTVSYSVSNAVNYELVGIGATNPAIEFPAIYGNFLFGYTVTLSSTLGQVVGVSVTSSPAVAPATVLTTNSVRIERNPAVELFPNERYNFVTILPSSQKFLESYPPGQTSSAGTETSVYDWDTPSVREVTGSYTFVVTYFDVANNINNTETATLSQQLVWSQFPGLVLLGELVSRSKW
jgi:hypothetical protein